MIRQADPLVCVGGRHADVRDHDVRRVACDRHQGLLGIGKASDDLDGVAEFQQQAQAFTDEVTVVHDKNPDRRAGGCRWPPRPAVPAALALLASPSSDL
ncbi:MAG: hypothetical protein V9E98_10430 [Candidatus Nanopelagicales bacterium]